MDTAQKRRVLFADPSPQFDYGSDEGRWQRSRPTVDVCAASNFHFDEVRLRYLHGQEALAKQLVVDIGVVSPGTKVWLDSRQSSEAIQNSSDFELFYLGIYEYYSRYPFDYENNDYYVFLPPGKGATHTLALVLVFTYLHVQVSFVHHKVTLGNTMDRVKQEYMTYQVDLPMWMAMIGRTELNQLSALGYLKFNIDTQNNAYNELMQRLEHVALNSRAPILLAGESGVGKTYLARRVYDLKHKAGQVAGKFVEVNCGLLRGEGLMSLLFGHTKGAYTGAAAPREGLLKSADNGVLFLDEISEMPLAEQAVLLKAIEEKVFRPFGGDDEVRSNFQLICGTNRDLHACVQNGSFRHDLLARIALWTINLPPLRERPEDIEPNIAHELKLYTIRTARKTMFDPEALKMYLNFACSKEALWVGNLRSLSASVERMATFAPMGIINTRIVQEEIVGLRRAWAGYQKTLSAPAQSGLALPLAPASDHLHQAELVQTSNPKLNPNAVNPENHNLPNFSPLETSQPSLLSLVLPADQVEQLDLFDKFHLEGTLRVCQKAGNRSEAGRLLFANSRTQKKRIDDTTRLNNYLKGFGLSWESIKKSLP